MLYSLIKGYWALWVWAATSKRSVAMRRRKILDWEAGWEVGALTGALKGLRV